MFNQDDNFREAIRNKKARIEEINLILAQPRPGGTRTGSRTRLIEKRLHLEHAVAELEAERSRLRAMNVDKSFRWEDLDQRLLSPKTNGLAQEMHKRAADAQRRIAYEVAQSGNSAGYLPRWIEFHEQLVDEWAEKLYAAYCQAWTEQNRTISPTFIRAVRDRAIATLMAARRSSVSADIQLRAVRIGDTGNPQNSAVIGEWTRRMDRLAARLNEKLEAEAVAAEYRAAKPPQVSPLDLYPRPLVMPEESMSVLQSDVWRRFHETFRALAQEELVSDPRNLHDRYLRAYASYENNAPETGFWQLGGGANESIRERFKVAATRAGISLHPRPADKRFEAWLHHLFLDLLEHKSDLLFAGKINAGGIVVRVCEASAVSCARLESQALESESGAQIQNSQVPGTLPISHPLISRRKATRSPDFVVCAANLWLNAKRESSNATVTTDQLKQIASSLDEQQYVPPAKYLEREAATKLREFNSKNSCSKIGPIQTWFRLVEHSDKDHLRDMRRLLSRCANNHAVALSGVRDQFRTKNVVVFSD